MWLGFVCVTSVLAADAELPSEELLLYLADWGTDESGRAIDPLELADDDSVIESLLVDQRGDVNVDAELKR